jgi:hypothetical protein
MPKTVIGEDDEPAKGPATPAARPAAASSKRTKADAAEMAGIGGPVAAVHDEAPASGVSVPESRAAPDTGVGDGGTAPVDVAGADVVAPEEPAPAPPPWSGLTVAIIDDAIHLPRLDRLSEGDAAAVSKLLAENAETKAELNALGCNTDAMADERLRMLAESYDAPVTTALVGLASSDALRMIEEHRAFRRLHEILTDEVQDVTVCDPYVALPDLSSHNLILLDYYLEGPLKGGDLAVAVATAIRGQANRAADQQIVLMSSLETVRDTRGEFRTETDLTGSAFAFIGKRDLNEAWKVKAHLGMLERARPYAPAFTAYRSKLDEALTMAREDLLKLVDDLDIGDYAFLQSRALMKDGHPLGDYVFWLLSSQLMAFAFERDEMRERQRALDALEFVGAPFAATEPSTVVANLLHSALVSRNMGPLGPHPRAAVDSAYAGFPLVQLGDVFLDGARTKAVVVMSADCDLAFSPMQDRPPDADTPVMLVTGVPIKLKDVKEDAEANTDGLLHRDEVYRIVWDFAKYRSVPLGGLRDWLVGGGYDVTNRDRLRPLFALKLQQEFGAHLMRVGPPIMPPMTTKARGRVLICVPEQEEVAAFSESELMLTRFKKLTWLRVTPWIAGTLRQQCEELRLRVEEQRDAAEGKKRADLQKKVDSIVGHLDDDDFWISLLDGVELNAPGSVKTVGPLGIVVGTEWNDSKVRVMLEITEDVPPPKNGPGSGPPDGLDVTVEVGGGAVSAAA